MRTILLNFPGWLLALGVLASGGAVQAQYKVIGPDGKITYTDRPPVDAPAARVPLGPVSAGTPVINLPDVLRPVVARYPVVLYAAKACRACDAGRQLLVQRGIPFTEKRVDSPADILAFRAISADGSIPVLTIGQQRLTGLVAADWQSYLTAAGYPENSVLPANYVPAPPQALAPPATTRRPTPAEQYPDSHPPMPDDPAPARAPGATGPTVRF